MAKKKTNNILFVLVVLLSVFSFVFTNAEACHTLNDPQYSYELELQKANNTPDLLPELMIVKELLARGLDILSSNFEFKPI